MSKPDQKTDFHVRIAGATDAEEIARVINSAFRSAESFFIEGDRIDLNEVVQSMSTGTFLLADAGCHIVGSVYVESRGERAYLGLLSVDPSHQQSGVGSRLMTAAEDYCRGLGCRFMDIKLVNLRKELPSFYQKRGYVETGTSSFPAGVKTTVPCYFIDMAKPLNEDRRD